MSRDGKIQQKLDINQIITRTKFAATIAIVTTLLIVVLLKPKSRKSKRAALQEALSQNPALWIKGILCLCSQTELPRPQLRSPQTQAGDADFDATHIIPLEPKDMLTAPTLNIS